MTIRGTSNESVKTTVRSVLGQGIEHGPARDADGGGAGQPQVGSGEYVEANDQTHPGNIWTPAYDHLPLGTPQNDYSAT